MGKKNGAASKLEPLGDVVAKAAEAVGGTAKAAAKMAEPTVKAAEDALKATGKKTRDALVPEVHIQWGDRDLLCAEAVERARKDYKASHKAAILSCRVYIKPEESTAYYVINDTEGKIDL